MESFPAVKICIPTHNSSKTLRETMKSVLDQNYPNIKVIVTDNASADDTKEIVKSFNNKRLFFRDNILSQDFGRDTVGALESCNNCFLSDLADGQFVAFYHSDDIYEKDMVRKEVEFLQKNPEAGAVFVLGKRIDKNGRVISKIKLPKELKDKHIYNFMDILNAILNNGNIFLQTPTFMTRKETFAKIGMFSEEFGTSADLEMWLRISEKYPIGILNENLYRCRVGGALSRYHHLRTEKAEFLKIMDYYLYDKSYISKADKNCLKQYERQKDFDDTFRAMNFLMRGNANEAKKIINRPGSWNTSAAYFENVNILKIKGLFLKIVLFLGINSGLGVPLGKLLKLYLLR